MAICAPIVVVRYLEGMKDSLHAGAVCAMWVGKVSRSIYLVRFNLTKKLNNDIDIFCRERTLLNTTSLVEWEV